MNLFRDLKEMVFRGVDMDERKIGEVFEREGLEVVTVKDEGRHPCRMCAFYPFDRNGKPEYTDVCLESECRREERSDGLSVHFEKVGLHHMEQED